MVQRRIFPFIAFAVLLALFGCGAGQNSADSAAMSSEASKASTEMGGASAPAREAGFAAQDQSATGGSAAAVQNRMVIRTAQLSIRVDSIEKAEREVSRIIGGLGGYVDSATSSDLDSGKPVLSVTMRVPVRGFESAMSKMEALGVRLSKQIGSSDVTEQVVDLDARIRTLRAQEEVFRQILLQSRRLQDVITLQDKLAQVRMEIESMAGQRKSLANQAAMSTLTVTLTQSLAPHQPPKDPNWLAQTWAEATSQLGGAVRAAAVVGIWVMVFSPFWIPLLLLGRKAWKKSLHVT